MTKRNDQTQLGIPIPCRILLKNVKRNNNRNFVNITHGKKLKEIVHIGHNKEL